MAGIKSMYAALAAVFLASAAQALTFQGAMVDFQSSHPVSVPNSYYGAYYIRVPFQTAIYDTSGFWDSTTNQMIVPSTIPAGTYGVVMCHLRWQPNSNASIQVFVSKFDASAGVQLHSGYPESAPDNRAGISGTTADHFSVTHPILLEPGDAYSCTAWQQGASGGSGSINIIQGGMSLQILN